MLLWCFWKKLSFCYSAWLISGSHWIIVSCLQLIKATLASFTTLPWFLWRQGGEILLSPGFCSTLWLALGWQGFVRKSQPCRLGWQPPAGPASEARSLLSLPKRHARVRLGEGHRGFKGCSVPVPFLVVQPHPRSLELEHKHTKISTPFLHQKPISILFGWLVGFFGQFVLS